MSGIADDDGFGLVDGPGQLAHIVKVVSRGLVVLFPFVAVPAAIGFPLVAVYGHAVEDSLMPAIIVAAIGLFIILLAAIGAPSNKASQRRRRDLLIALRSGSLSSESGPRVCWTATLLSQGARYDGSLHLSGSLVRFLWHQPPNVGVSGPDVRQEILLELPVADVSAIEVEPSRSLGETWYVGSPVVVLLLRDGRKIRFGAIQAARLASILRERIGKPEGSPTGAPLEPTALDKTPVEEIARSLVRRADLVALIVHAKDLKEPFVVLHGAPDALRGNLELARDALARERELLAPYLSARAAEKPP